MVVEILFWLVSLILIVVGLVGLVLPALPGAPVLFLGLLAAAWAENFSYVGVYTLIILGIMAFLTYAVDFAAGAFGAKRFGASRRSVFGATIGALVGIFFGIPGLLLGPFVGAVIGELSYRPDIFAAGRAGLGATLGLALGVGAKLSLGVSMVGIFVFVRFVSAA
jgi:uncharacterized protein YqgC (DUF456 family)